ncbi:MAG: hypothetical protein ACRYFY_21520, partial [Janthinobacterium lividum]
MPFGWLVERVGAGHRDGRSNTVDRAAAPVSIRRAPPIRIDCPSHWSAIRTLNHKLRVRHRRMVVATAGDAEPRPTG